MVETSTFTEWKSTTPLLLACYNGFLDIATFLIEQCNVDVDEVGTVTIGKCKETIEDVPPLWCASASGHLNLVKFLVRCGASINKTTKSNSSPLRAACYEGHFDIVVFLIQHGADIEIANKIGHTCLMIACYKNHLEIVKYLLDKGADINRTSDDGHTALCEAAELGDLAMVKLLLKHGAKKDGCSNAITPLLEAAAEGHEDIVKLFTEELDCTKEEKVNAFELLGASFMSNKMATSMAFKYWKQAMELRYENLACPLEKPIVDSCLGAYLNETEVHTLSELEKLKLNYDRDKMEIQALLVRERIIGLERTLHFVKLRGARQIDNQNYCTGLKLLAFVLDSQQKLQKPFSRVTHVTLYQISEICSQISDNSRYAKKHHLFSNILQVFEIALKEIEVSIKLSQNQSQDLTSGTQFFHTVICAIYLVSFMHKMQPYLNETQKSKLNKAADQLIHINPRSKDGSILHFLTCFKRRDFLNLPMVPFPSSEMIDLLSKIGDF